MFKPFSRKQAAEIETLEATPPAQLWANDLDALEAALVRVLLPYPLSNIKNKKNNVMNWHLYGSVWFDAQAVEDDKRIKAIEEEAKGRRAAKKKGGRGKKKKVCHFVSCLYFAEVHTLASLLKPGGERVLHCSNNLWG